MFGDQNLRGDSTLGFFLRSHLPQNYSTALFGHKENLKTGYSLTSW